VLQKAADREDIDVILRFMRRQWRNGIFEDADTSFSLPLKSAALFPAKNWRDFFIYRDRKTYLSWERSGATRSNRDGMIYFLIRPSSITCVIGSSRASLNLIHAIRAVLRQKMQIVCSPPPMMRAA
jgi:hypothetical protein